MKSRLLSSTTVVLFLLLGLVTSNLFAQLTSTASVTFKIRSYKSNSDVVTTGDPSNWKTASAGYDTVGRKMDVAVSWKAQQDAPSGYYYTFAFPLGAVVYPTVKDSIYITYAGSDLIETVVKVAASDVTILAGNDTTGYAEDVTPSVKVKDNNYFSTQKTFTVTFLKGIYLSKSVAGTNSTDDSKMKFSFTVGTATFSDSNFYAVNDLAEGVEVAPAVTGYVNGSFWPVGDSVYVVDRFGNSVPNFLYNSSHGSNDTLRISVSAHTEGVFNDSAYTNDGADHHAAAFWGTNKAMVYNSDSTAINFVSASAANGGDDFVATRALITNDGLFHGSTADKSVTIFLGEKEVVAASGNYQGSAKLKFTAPSGKDSTVFTWTLWGPNKASGKVLDVTADNTTRMKRTVYVSAVSKQIGSLDLAYTGSTGDYNGKALTGTLKVTLLNVFGDAFNAKAIGTDIDSIMVYFRYKKAGSLNVDLTTMLQAGGQITANPVRTRVASRFYGANWASNTSAPYGNRLNSGTTNASGVITMAATTYLGTTSHASANKDSIYVVAYAANSSTIRDSVLICVQPSPPTAFNIDTFQVNLQAAMAAGQVVQGAQISRDLPIFALDTAYNRVSNMTLAKTTTYLDAITNNGYSIKLLNLLIDGRDPVGYMSKSKTDSIRIDWPSARTGTYGATDSSFIYDLNRARKDSSRINFGSVGRDSLGLRLNYVGTNYRLSIKWDPGTAGSYLAGDFPVRTQDLGLFTLLPATAVDSVISLAASGDAAGSVSYQVVQFVAPQGNSLGPNQADSVIYISFVSLPTGAGLGTLTKDSVLVSIDNTNWYKALNIWQSTDTGKEDSVALVTPIFIDASSANSPTVYVKLNGFTYPTRSDTSYGVRVATKASPVTATLYSAIAVTDSAYGAIKIAKSNQAEPSVTTALNMITAPSSVTLKAGADSLFKIVLADRYGNVINKGSSTGFVAIIKGPGATGFSQSLAVKQVFNGTTTTSRGTGMYDSLRLQVDTTAAGTYTFIDSILVNPAMVGTYYVVFQDSAKSWIKDSVQVTVKPTTADSIILSPDSLARTSRGSAMPYAYTATLYDTFGNTLSDSIVSFKVVYGGGTFADSNGVAIAAGIDSLGVKTNASGQAKATLKAGSLDSLAVKVFIAGRTNPAPRYVSATARATATQGRVTFVTFPDSIVPDTTNAVSVAANAVDADLIKKVYLIRYKTQLVQGTDHKFTLAATTDTAKVDSSVVSTVPHPDSLRFSGSIPAIKLGYQVKYAVQVVDNNDSTALSTVKTYIVAPKRGKQSLGTAATNVADLMRTVYLVLGAVTAPTTIDWLGLDLDQSGDFNTPDLVGVLAIWKGTGTLLAGAAKQENRTAKVALGYKEIDKANATLSINLENSGSLNLGIFKIKYDPSKFVLGKAVATNRLGEGMELVFHNNEAEGTYGVVVLNINGRPISSGNGAILTIPVTAKGEKFDGTGDISLLSVGFEQDVQTEMNKEALSPKAILPKAFALSQNFPNPFNPSTTIAFDIPEGQKVHVTLNVYNMRGQLVRSLVNEVRNEGAYQIQWDGSDNNGGKVSSGVYFYRIKAGDFSNTRKMVILK